MTTLAFREKYLQEQADEARRVIARLRGEIEAFHASGSHDLANILATRLVMWERLLGSYVASLAMLATEPACS